MSGNWPTRAAFAWLTLGLALFAVYLSLIPFHYHPVPFPEARSLFTAAFTEPTTHEPRTDFVGNAIYFVVLGVAFAGTVSLDRRLWVRIAAMPLTIAGLALVSLGLEFAQVFFPDRVVSAADVFAAVCGSAGGALLWALAGQRVVDWFRSGGGGAGESDGVVRVLAIYAAGLVLARLLPFDISLDVGQLAAKYRAGGIELVPFSQIHSVAALCWAMLWASGTAAPLGALAALLCARRRVPHAWLVATAAGTAVVAGIEVAQVPVLSRVAPITDVLLGAFGVGVGALLVRLSPDGARATTAAEAARNDGRTRGLALVGLLVWALVVVSYHWQPFDFVVAPAALAARMKTLSAIPFAGYYGGDLITALEQFLLKFALAAPGGMLARWLWPGRRSPELPGMLAVVCLAAVFFGTIEAGQILLPSRVPDVGDAIVGMVGSLVGLWISVNASRK